MIWHSNIWKNNNALFYFSQPELDENFINFSKKLGALLQKPVWINEEKDCHDAIFGESLDKAFAIATCGYGLVDLNKFKKID